MHERISLDFVEQPCILNKYMKVHIRHGQFRYAPFVSKMQIVKLAGTDIKIYSHFRQHYKYEIILAIY